MSSTSSTEDIVKDIFDKPCSSSDIQGDLQDAPTFHGDMTESNEDRGHPFMTGSASTSVTSESVIVHISPSDSTQVIRLVAPQRYKISLSEARRKALNALKRANQRRREDAQTDVNDV